MSRFDDDLWELVPDAGPPPPHLRDFVRGLPAVGRALDLGCGDGRLTKELRGEQLVGVDVSEVALARARGRLPEAGFVHVAPDEPLPFADTAFDLVLCAETLEHVRDVQLLLSEARRVLQPGGMLAVTTPAHGRLTAVRAALGGFEEVFDPLSPHLRFFTARSLARLLDQLGFDGPPPRRASGTLLVSVSRAGAGVP